MTNYTIELNNGTKVHIERTEVRIIDDGGTTIFSTLKYRGFPDLPYFFAMGKKEREKVQSWLDEVGDGATPSQENFIERVRNALCFVNYDYLISTLEPSLDKKGNIYFKKGDPVGTDITAEEWTTKAKAFYKDDNDWHSELATLYEGDLFTAYRIAMEYWSIQYVCDNSSTDGNYKDSPLGTNQLDVSGAKEVGGFNDGIGNSYKVYMKGMYTYAMASGGYWSFGKTYPVSYVFEVYNSDACIYFGSGVIVIKK